MTIKEIILELKKICSQWIEQPLTEEKRSELVIALKNNREQVMAKINSIIVVANKKENSGANKRLTLLFFANAALGLVDQFLIDEKKDIISLSVSCTLKDKLSSVFSALIAYNLLNLDSLEKLCVGEGIEMSTSMDDDIYTIWFEINTLGLTKEKEILNILQGDNRNIIFFNVLVFISTPLLTMLKCNSIINNDRW